MITDHHAVVQVAVDVLMVQRQEIIVQDPQMTRAKESAVLMITASHRAVKIGMLSRPETFQKYYLGQGSDASSVWNIFCARFSDMISRGNQWCVV